jgi:hypothetical protein
MRVAFGAMLMPGRSASAAVRPPITAILSDPMVIGVYPCPQSRWLGSLRPLPSPEFLERNLGIEFAIAGKSAEAAIAAGDQPLAPDDVAKRHMRSAISYGMLDIIGRSVEHAGDEDLARLLPYRPFMRTLRILPKERKGPV